MYVWASAATRERRRLDRPIRDFRGERMGSRVGVGRTAARDERHDCLTSRLRCQLYRLCWWDACQWRCCRLRATRDPTQRRTRVGDLGLLVPAVELLEQPSGFCVAAERPVHTVWYVRSRQLCSESSLRMRVEARRVLPGLGAVRSAAKHAVSSRGPRLRRRIRAVAPLLRRRALLLHRTCCRLLSVVVRSAKSANSHLRDNEGDARHRGAEFAAHAPSQAEPVHVRRRDTDARTRWEVTQVVSHTRNTLNRVAMREVTTW